MTNFNKDNFKFDGMYLNYVVDGESKFVARFKHDAAEHKVFANFIRKHFTVEEYFKAMEAGFTPSDIAEARGYASGHPRRFAKRAGFPATKMGTIQFLAKQYDYTREQYLQAVARHVESAAKVEMAIAA